MKTEDVFLQPWEALEEQFTILRDLKGCRQDPLYHAEGDVYIHTQNVLKALEQLDAWHALEPRARAIVRAGALFHDVGKPAKTVLGEDGRISSKNHALRGAQMVRSLLYRDLPLPFEDREAIATLVLLHSLPAMFLEKPDPKRSVIRASLAVNCYWLSLVAQADALGRLCAETDGARVEQIELFRDFCRENLCLNKPRAFPSDYSRFQFFRGRESLDYAAFDNSTCEVVLLSGLPAAGKDTLVRDRLLNWPVVSLDEIREETNTDPEDAQGPVIASAKELARKYLRDKRPLVWNATNVTRLLRRSLVEFFTGYGARVRILYVESPYMEVLRRNKTRKVPVPIRVIDALVDKMEVPQLDEACSVECVVK